MTAQQALFAEPAPATGPTLGTRFRYRTAPDRGRREDVVYELEAIDRNVDPVYCYRLRLVEVVSSSVPSRRVGEDTIHVEALWFELNPYVSAVGGGK